MRYTATILGVAAVLAIALAQSVAAVELPVRYLVDARAFKEVINGAALSFDLFSDSACTNMVNSESVTAGSTALLVQQVKPAKVSGQSPSPAKGLHLVTVLNPSALEDQFWVQVTGAGITPIGNPCQPLPPSPVSVQDNGVANSQLAADAVTADKILDGTIVTADIGDTQVTNAKLANSSLTVTAGTGLTGGGSVGLGGSTTLDNSGVLSVGASAPLMSSGGQNPSVSLSGTVAVANGGTGATTASGARNGLGAAASGANADITSLSGITGNITLPASTSAANGNVFKSGDHFIHNYGGASNVFVGVGAGNFSLTEGNNSGVGHRALQANSTGAGNTAVGQEALTANTGGSTNTALGAVALYSNTTAHNNTAVGANSLQANSTGQNNTAIGQAALQVNTAGDNTAVGWKALQASTSGSSNTAVGNGALLVNSTGSTNIAVGNLAGANLTTGSNNIDIGNAGVAAESNTIRIGTAGTQTATYIAGIRGVTTGVANGIAVLIDGNGQLGTVSSSQRFKTDIHDMADTSSKLMQLRPVTFRYKPEIDPSATRQYGLIAEEVEKVMPDLVAYAKDGKIETVKYHLLAGLLLNEMQKQQRQIATEQERVAEQARAMKVQAQQIEALTTQVREVRANANQIEALTARLIQLEGSIHTQKSAPALEASYRQRAGL